MTELTPQESWQVLTEGNRRFSTDTATHPHQDVARRKALVDGQTPFAAVFGCGDSREAVETIFDAGLGDLFVVRTAGHTLDNAVIGSLEYAVGDVGVSVLVVLGHTNCGAVTAAVNSEREHTYHPAFYVRDLIARLHTAVAEANHDDHLDVPTVERLHVINTVHTLAKQSSVIATALANKSLAIIGATYELETGAVVPILAEGAISLP